MKDYDSKLNGNWEQQINALLDGELGQVDADELKSAATDDRELARAKVLDCRCWVMPVLANGHIYVKDNTGQLVCLDVRDTS